MSMVLRRKRQEPAPPAPVLLAELDPPIGELITVGPRLGELLLSSGALDDAKLREALAAQAQSAQRLGAILVEKGLVDERALARALGAQFGIRVIDLRREGPQPDASKYVPEATARSLDVLPLRAADGTLDVAIADPLDPRVADTLKRLPAHHVNVHLAAAGDIRAAVNRAYTALAEVGQHIEEFATAEGERALPPPTAPAVDLTGDSDAPIIQVVNKVVTQALRDRASDVHIEPLDDRMRVRYRIDGALKEVLSLPLAMGPALVSRIKIMAEMNIVERRRPQDGQFQLTVDGREVDVRVATTATIFGEKVVMRLLDKSRSLLQLGELGMPAETHALFARLVRSPFGMVICSGPTGSGKTTTLYATLSEINRDELNVMTIEDPVEYVFPKINQMQINAQADVTFASGLKSILRQDPDVILVGEIRDVETARIAVQSALTGHLVLSSMHATDASSALFRLLDMGIESFLIASAVTCVVGQRLVRRICPSCKEPYTPSDTDLLFYEEVGGKPKDAFFYGTGCNFCSGTGYYDRIGVYEAMAVTDEMRALIVGRATPHEARELAVSQGMRTLVQEGVRLVEEDVTTIPEIIRNVYVG